MVFPSSRIVPQLQKFLASESRRCMSNISSHNAAFPPTHFQDATRVPPTFDQYQPKQKQFSVLHLFSDKQTRPSSLALLSSFMLAYGALLYQLYESEKDLAVAKNEMQHAMDEKDMSQTVMAVHIGLLRRQLVDEGISPIPTSQALRLSRSFLNLRDGETVDGQIQKYANHKSVLYQLIPLHSEYDASRIFKYN